MVEDSWKETTVITLHDTAWYSKRIVWVGIIELLLPCFLVFLCMLCHWYKNDNKFQETWCWSFFGCYMLWVAWVTSCDSSPVGWVLTHKMRVWFKPPKNLTWKKSFAFQITLFKNQTALQVCCNCIAEYCCVYVIDIKYILKWFDIVYEYMWYNDICVSDIGFNLIIRYKLFTIYYLLYDIEIPLHVYVFTFAGFHQTVSTSNISHLLTKDGYPGAKWDA